MACCQIHRTYGHPGRPLLCVCPRPGQLSLSTVPRQQLQHNPVLVHAAAGQIDINHIYSSSEGSPQPYVGPVKAVRLKVGLGLESSRSLQAGETLLLSTPLALVSHTAEELANLAPAPSQPSTAAATAAKPNAAGTSGDVEDNDVGDDDDKGGDESGYDEGGEQYQPTDADIDQLVEQLAGSSNARTQAWLQYLDDGSLDASQNLQLPDLLTLAALASSSSSSSNQAPSATTAAVPPSSSSSSRQLDEDTLLDITDLNVQVLVEDDALLGLSTGAAAAAGSSNSGGDGGGTVESQEPRTLVGIWPELNLLQHSCSPNTSVVAHKSAAIISASRSIPKQAALSRNLLGPHLLAPLAERRALLQEASGATCMCPRCRDEERTDRSFQQLVADIYESCMQQVGPELEQAVEVDDEAALEGLRDQLAAYCEVVDAAFSKFAVKQQTQIWLQASLFKLYELTAIATAACGAADARLVELLAALAGEVSPGSNEHIFWARQYRDEIAADEDSYFDGALRQAEKLLLAAYQARYGRGLSRALYKQLDALAQPPQLQEEEEE